MARFSQRQILSAGGAAVAVVLLIVFGVMAARRGSVEKAFERLLAADTFHVTAELAINLPARFRGGERPFTRVIAHVAGDLQRTEGAGAELTGDLSLEARGRGVVFSAEGQTRVLHDRVLYTLDTLPVFLNPKGNLLKRWTRVPGSLLTVNNAGQIREALLRAVSGLQRNGIEGVEGERLRRYSGALTEEQEQQLAEATRISSSGSQAWYALARLLEANRVKAVDAWVDSRSGELRKVQVQFVRDLSNGSEFEFATLTVTFTDYNKRVEIETPESELFVQPHAFAKLFGGGEVEEVKAEAENQE